VEELIAVDRRFAATPDSADAIAKIVAMLADDVTMPTPGGDFARSRSEAIQALRTALGPGRGAVTWAAIRGGISADGQHGFTFGYMTVSGPDTANLPFKYLSYWVRGTDGWRVVAYRLARRALGPVAARMMPPSLPNEWVRPTDDVAAIERHRVSLVAAERAFSDRAQVVGLGPAFAENGHADAVNMGGRGDTSFVVGARAIGQAIGAGSTEPGSPVAWGADRAIVASSGDLGVTFGVIRPNRPPPDASRATSFPFFTIWRRAHVGEPWRYIAE
jgi:ketosteroid isomerase-like protein